ncbi:unnamed protein product [Caenorhabditis bovis]|uniref:Uncharacterized protein n=1 Tax=Caenorhabditis bovis TaxID=2654633 RepID=A0A8S1EJI6_9PELO|nr:unnamed protein product [Caenorhabditis bovis]
MQRVSEKDVSVTQPEGMPRREEQTEQKGDPIPKCNNGDNTYKGKTIKEVLDAMFEDNAKPERTNRPKSKKHRSHRRRRGHSDLEEIKILTELLKNSSDVFQASSSKQPTISDRKKSREDIAMETVGPKQEHAVDVDEEVSNVLGKMNLINENSVGEAMDQF